MIFFIMMMPMPNEFCESFSIKQIREKNHHKLIHSPVVSKGKTLLVYDKVMERKLEEHFEYQSFRIRMPFFQGTPH